ncbi:MAG: metal ABC transporter permease [Actinomycetota bacterium]|nr:metal ABC transporter permease [Actinomycetota bacterium]
MSALVEPFDFAFFRNGVMVASLAGALCGLVGVYVVLRGMSYIGHGLSHAIFGGAAASAVMSVNVYVGAGVWGVISALMIGRIARRRIIGSDAAIGVITTASFALGLILFGLFGTARRSVDAVLFGSILGVTATDVWVVAAVFVAASLVVFFRYRALLFATFDAEVAEVSGVNTARVDALLMLVLATSILATMKVIGVVLVAAMLVIPPVIARMLTDGFVKMLGLSVVVGAVCGFAGMYLSYYLDAPSGATIALAGAVVFGLVFAVTGSGRLQPPAEVSSPSPIPSGS